MTGEIVSADNTTIRDSGSNGISLGANEDGFLNINSNEYALITASEIVLETSNTLLVKTGFSSDSPVALSINAGEINIASSAPLALSGDLNFNNSAITADNGLNIDLTSGSTAGEFEMGGSAAVGSDVSIKAEAITMKADSVIKTSSDDVDLVATVAAIRLGLIDAEGANVNVTAATDILNNNELPDNILRSQDNIRASTVTLDAVDRIGVASTDAVTLNIDRGGLINLDFGADIAYINNLNSTKIKNNSNGGTVAVGLIFSGQIIGIGHNIGADATDILNDLDQANLDEINLDETPISILGADFQIIFDGEEDEDDVVSTIIPSVPVMIKGRDGWEFVAPTRRQNLDRIRENQEKGERFVDWL